MCGSRDPHRQHGHAPGLPHRVNFGMRSHDDSQGGRICLIDGAAQVEIVNLNHRFTTEPIARDLLRYIAPDPEGFA